MRIISAIQVNGAGGRLPAPFDLTRKLGCHCFQPC